MVFLVFLVIVVSTALMAHQDSPVIVALMALMVLLAHQVFLDILVKMAQLALADLVVIQVQ